MLTKDEQITSAPVNSDLPSGLGKAVGEIENPVRELPCGPEDNVPQQAGYKVADHDLPQQRALQIGRSPYKGRGEGANEDGRKQQP